MFGSIFRSKAPCEEPVFDRETERRINEIIAEWPSWTREDVIVAAVYQYHQRGRNGRSR